MNAADKKALLKKISTEAKQTMVFNSKSFGRIEAWVLVTCWLDTSEQEGNDLIAHVESALSYESEEVQEYFSNLGITF